MPSAFIPAVAPACFTLLLLFACTSEPQEQQQALPENLSLTEADKNCLASGNRICEPGLPFSLLGQSMQELSLPNPENIRVTDSVIQAGGYYWNMKTLRTPAGLIVLEGDFIDDRSQGLEGLPQYQRISRIRIETPEYSTSQGISVENNVGDLRNALGEADLLAQYLPGYASIDISIANSQIHYLIRDENGQFDKLSTPEMIPVEEIPDGIQIYAIVLR